ncbi:LLM class flavin-dependent oxidoreductase [Microbacterium sp.]|uniref:LLM class flavin-dependent oxidoreductase n=1 Tax=Microbacterium sp. TaxID=51671 RepID=UPI003A894D8C
MFFNPMVPKHLDSEDWAPDQEKAELDSMLEQIRFADSLGFDYVFLGEHHFTAEYAHNTATEVLLGALSQTTTTIRLGTGIVHASHNDPVRTAERIATLDQISGGRAEFGFGPGTPGEVAPLLRVPADRVREVAAASGQISADILGTRGVWPGVDNEFFTYPAVDVIPKSYQTPHPPLWTSATQPGANVGIAARGLGSLMLTVGGPDLVAAEVRAYWDRLKQGDVQMVGKGINPAVFTFTVGLIAPTDEEAQLRAREGVEMFGYGLTGGSYARIGDPEHHLHRAWRDFKAGRGDIRESLPLPAEVLAMGAAFADAPGSMMGSPETARKLTRQIEATHADGLLLNQDFGYTSHEHQMESIELWATEVIPEFRERHHEHEEWRRQQIEEIGLPVVTSL